MATTRNKRVPMQEQIKLINECRKSGLTDADWCRENGIAPSTFYNWVSRCRKTAADIQEPNYGHHETPQPKQDVVSVDIIPDEFPESSAVVQPQTPLNLDNSHTIEIEADGLLIRMSNEIKPLLLKMLMDTLKEPLC